MKKIDWSKMGKRVGIILLVVLVILYFDYRSSKRTAMIEDNVGNLNVVSEELDVIRSTCTDAMNSGDYEDMYYALYDIDKKCKELQRLVDQASTYFTPSEPDYDNSRSWWY